VYLYQQPNLVPVQQPYQSPPQTPPTPQSATRDQWIAVLVLNILGLNWVSRFITGHVGTGILVLVLYIVAVATAYIGFGLILGIGLLVIWILDLVTIGTKKWKTKDGVYLMP
jgi:hypothetical protein